MCRNKGDVKKITRVGVDELVGVLLQQGHSEKGPRQAQLCLAVGARANQSSRQEQNYISNSNQHKHVTIGCLQATPKSKIARDRGVNCAMEYYERAESLWSLKGGVDVLINSSQ